jgi:hypothetical protein
MKIAESKEVIKDQWHQPKQFKINLKCTQKPQQTKKE